MKKIKNLMNHPLFSGSAIMFAGNMGANVINYGYHLIMGRVLGPVEYGILSSLYSILYLVSIIPSSASISIVKFISSAKDDQIYSVYSQIMKIIFKLSIVMSFIILISSTLIAKFLHIDNILSIILLSPILFLSLLTLVNQATSQGLIKFVGHIVPTLISSALKFLLGLIFVYIGWAVQGAMLAIAIGALISFVYSYKFIKKHIPRTKLITVDLKPFIKYSGPVLLQSLAFTSIFTVDVMLVKHFLDPFSAGIYAALSTLGKIIFFATSAISTTMFPVVSKRISLKQEYKKIFLLSLLATFSIAFVITCFYWLFPNIAIGILYGKDYLSAKNELVLMGIFMLFYTQSHLIVNFFLSIGKIRIVIIPLLAALIQIVIIWFNHYSINQIVKVSLTVTVLMFICLSLYTIYNFVYATKNKK